MDIKGILAAHTKWLLDEVDGKRADLRGANLYGAELRAWDTSLYHKGGGSGVWTILSAPLL